MAISEARVASPAPLTTAEFSGGNATSATVVSVNQGSVPAEFEGSGVSSSPGVGREGSDRVSNGDAQSNSAPSTREMETGKPIPPLVLDGKESARLKWTAEDPTGTGEGRTRGDVCLLQALNGAALVAREMGMEVAFEKSAVLTAHYSYVGSLSDFKGKFLIDRADDIAFQMEARLLRLRQVLVIGSYCCRK